MTYGENRKIFLALVDEYAPNNTYFTTDEDIKEKCALLYAPAYQELADIRTPIKTRNIEHTATNEEGYTEYSLPKCKQVKKVTAKDNKNNLISGDYYFEGENKIFVKSSLEAKYVIEYVPFINLISEATEEDDDLEIEQDLQVILPYLVASDLLKTDPSADWTAFEKVLQRKLQGLNTNRKGISVNITEGEL